MTNVVVDRRRSPSGQLATTGCPRGLQPLGQPRGDHRLHERRGLFVVGVALDAQGRRRQPLVLATARNSRHGPRRCTRRSGALRPIARAPARALAAVRQRAGGDRLPFADAGVVRPPTATTTSPREAEPSSSFCMHLAHCVSTTTASTSPSTCCSRPRRTHAVLKRWRSWTPSDSRWSMGARCVCVSRRGQPVGPRASRRQPRAVDSVSVTVGVKT